MFDIVEQRAGGSILLAIGQFFDLAQCLFEQFCHASNLAYLGRSFTPSRVHFSRRTKEGAALARRALARFNASKGAIEMTLKTGFHGAALLAAALVALAALTASPARADRCDDLASQLKNQIDGLRVGQTAAGVIYLAHPNAREITLGCSSRNFSNQIFAKADRKPTPAFIDLIASASAIIFTLPKDDMLKGATRCVKRTGILRGDDVSIRYRRLDMRCMRTKTESSITISRRTDQ
jgi:hypothetical protein